jgi:hypothetical protein
MKNLPFFTGEYNMSTAIKKFAINKLARELKLLESRTNLISSYYTSLCISMFNPSSWQLNPLHATS